LTNKHYLTGLLWRGESNRRRWLSKTAISDGQRRGPERKEKRNAAKGKKTLIKGTLWSYSTEKRPFLLDYVLRQKKTSENRD